ncbi:MAG: rod shape-determining protein MreC [Gemmatimonadales bacterium]
MSALDRPSPFGPDRSSGRRDSVLALFSVGVSLVFLLGPASWGDTAGSLIRASVLRPFLWLQAEAVAARTSRTRFASLETERDSVAFSAQQVPALEVENERLRRLLGLAQRLTTPYIASEVLRQPELADGRTLLVAAGADRGVRPFDPVVSPEGLVGVVQTVEPTTSIVLTWAHPEFRVSTFVGDGAVAGIIAAAELPLGSNPMLELRGIPYRDTVPVGSPVLSSGLGGVYPKGIPVGLVAGVLREQPGWERIYLVRPAANLAAVSHVLILRGGPGKSVDAAFQPGGSP